MVRVTYGSRGVGEPWQYAAELYSLDDDITNRIGDRVKALIRGTTVKVTIKIERL